MTRIKKALASQGASLSEISAIYITHEHSDHIKGLKMINKYYNIPIYTSSGTAASLRYYSPELKERICEIEPFCECFEGGFKITPFPTPHDAAESMGYRIDDGKSVFVIATDMGYITKNIYNYARGADFAMLEANHDENMLRGGIYPYYLKERILSDRGHLSNTECARLVSALAKEGTARFLLAHLSRENNTPALACGAVKAALENGGFEIGRNISLNVAPADEMTPKFMI